MRQAQFQTRYQRKSERCKVFLNHTHTKSYTISQSWRVPVQRSLFIREKTLCRAGPRRPSFFQYIFELETGMKMLQVLVYLVVVLVGGRWARHWKDGEAEMSDCLDAPAVVRFANFLVNSVFSRFSPTQALWRVTHWCKRYVVCRPVTE